MSIRLLEQYDSRAATVSNTSSSAELHYVMTGTDDALEVNALVASSTPPAYGNLVRGDWSIEPVHVDSTNPDACIWDVKVKYVPPTDPKATTTDPATFNFDTGGGTQHIIASKSTVGAYGTGTATTDNGNLIGMVSSYKKADGTTHEMSDVYFNRDMSLTRATAPATIPKLGDLLAAPQTEVLNAGTDSATQKPLPATGTQELMLATFAPHRLLDDEQHRQAPLL